MRSGTKNTARWLKLCALVPIVLLHTPAEPVYALPHDEGKIAFVSPFGGPGDIFVTSPNGLTQWNLTNHPADDRDPDWSPDGSTIVFSSDRDGDSELFVMGADGSGLRKLTRNRWSDDQPSWSPDGKQIAYTTLRWDLRLSPEQQRLQSEIYVMNLVNGKVRRLTKNTHWDHSPAWSPDGSRIAFSRETDAGRWEILVMKADGSRVRRLTSRRGAFQVGPQWSPDGRLIVFTGTVDDFNFEIFVMRADGSRLKRLTRNEGTDQAPDWSPDGTRIVFESNRAVASELYVMDADGSNVRQITTNGVPQDSLARWTAGCSLLGSPAESQIEAALPDVC